MASERGERSETRIVVLRIIFVAVFVLYAVRLLACRF